MKNIILVILSLILTLQIQAQKIDKNASKVTFELSNMGFRTVEGTLGNMTGVISFYADDLANSGFSVCVDAASVNTENEKRDEHLRKEDFFDVANYPKICFESSTIEKSNNGFIAKGKLTMHGVTKDIEFPFTFSNNTFKGELEVNRLDYNVGSDTGTFMVGDETSIVIECILQK